MLPSTKQNKHILKSLVLTSAGLVSLSLCPAAYAIRGTCTQNQSVSSSCDDLLIADTNNNNYAIGNGVTVGKSIFSQNAVMFQNNSVINTFTNSGTINGASGIAAVYNAGTLTTLENYGSIMRPFYNGNVNPNSIGTLMNAQGAGNLNGALSWQGYLPTNYRIFITDPTHYGQLFSGGLLLGSMTFGIANGSTVAAGTYHGVLSGFTLANLTSGTSGVYNGLNWSLSDVGNNIWDLIFTRNGPSAEDTQAALQANVAALQGIYSIQTGTINNSLTYDCSYFDSKGLCLSTGGRYSNASNSHANTTSAMVIGGYRIDEHFRIGGYVDQNLYNTEAGSIASLRSNTPFLGVFGVWNENADQTGFEARLAAAYNNSNMDINRVQVGTSELGYGKTGIDTLSGSATLSYGFKVVPNWMASPYFGVRHTTVSSSGYSEQATTDVTAPLTYNGVNQESLTALLGIKASGRLTDQIGLQASAGLEQDTHTYTSAYSATGIDGLTSINFTPNMQKSRAVSTFGATYNVVKGHRLGLNAIWRQESFQNIDTKMAYVNYTMAF